MEFGDNTKYSYKQDVRKEAEVYLKKQMEKYFPDNSIEYIVWFFIESWGN